MLYKSIRWRIQAWHTLLLVCLVTGMLGAFYGYARGERFRIIDNQLQALLTPLMPKVMPVRGGRGPDDRPPPGPDDRPPGPDGGPDDRSDGPPPPRRPEPGPRPDTQTSFAEFEHGPFYYAAWTPDHRLISQSSNAKVPMPTRSESASEQYFRTRGGMRELVSFGPNDSSVVVGTSLALLAADLKRLAMILVGVGVGLTLFGLAGGWWVAGHALRPINEISGTARQIAGGRRSQRINVGDTESELGQLAEVLNQTFDRQDAALEQQVRFTADASHELRTPLSVIMTQIQLALSRDRTGEEYRATLQTCQRAAERMRALVNSLLELARVDSGDLQLKLETCDMATLAAESLELIAPLALEKGVVLHSSVAPIQAKADSTRLGQVVVNLLYNAIQHNANGVEVSLSVQSRGNEAVVSVADNGAGIPADALPHLFERFYRADKSRNGARNGTGLGLAISQAIVQAHGGTIRAENQPGHGAVFTVCVPLAV